MEFEIVVEGFVLDVEVTHCINQPPSPNTWDSDWDFYGERELEYKLLSAITYNEKGKRQPVRGSELHEISDEHDTAIRVALWHEIDSQARRSRWAA